MPYSQKVLAEQWIRSAWSVRPILFEKQLNCCEVRNVDDDDDDDDDNDNNNNNNNYNDNDNNNNNNNNNRASGTG